MELIRTLISDKELEYERMLRECNHKQGRELDIYKLRMRDLERDIQSLRDQIKDKVHTLLPS